MNKYMIKIMVVSLCMPLAACVGHKQEAGTAVGAILGGIIGSRLGQGQGKTAAIIGGALLGAYAGSRIGQYMDEEDARKTQQTLEQNKTGQISTWVNSKSGNQFTMTPTKDYAISDGQRCRKYHTEVITAGKKHDSYETACRQPDGSWKTVS